MINPFVLYGLDRTVQGNVNHIIYYHKNNSGNVQSIYALPNNSMEFATIKDPKRILLATLKFKKFVKTKTCMYI